MIAMSFIIETEAMAIESRPIISIKWIHVKMVVAAAAADPIMQTTKSISVSFIPTNKLIQIQIVDPLILAYDIYSFRLF